MTDDAGRALRERAELVMPGGVSSPVRAFRAVRGTAPAITRAAGAHLFDNQGNRFIDFVLAYGPHILGHNPPGVREALTEQLGRGVAFGTTTALEVELAERVVDAVPSIDMVRFVNSGTEATMSAIRVARAATQRDRIVKFAGCYHGHADALLADAGSGVATLGISGSPGVPAAAVEATAVLPYNDTDAVKALFAEQGERIAAVIVEPVAGNMGCVLPAPGFLEALRKLCSSHGSVLIFDEVMTGFRLAYGGAQQLLGVTPDLTCLGKVIGGGLPVAAYGGRRRLMALVAPQGPVYQAGTLSGSPLAMVAGCAVLDQLREGNVYEVLEVLGSRMANGLSSAAEEAGVSCVVNRAGSMVTPFLGVVEVTDFAGARRASTELFRDLHAEWLDAGVFWPPSQFESGFISSAHDPSDIDHAVEAFTAFVARVPSPALDTAVR